MSAVMLALDSQVVTAYGFQGGAAGLLVYLLRRWGKQRDDALTAAEKARGEEQTRCDDRVKKLEVRQEVALAELNLEVLRLRKALVQIIPAVENPEVRVLALRELWPTGGPNPPS